MRKTFVLLSAFISFLFISCDSVNVMIFNNMTEEDGVMISVDKTAADVMETICVKYKLDIDKQYFQRGYFDIRVDEPNITILESTDNKIVKQTPCFYRAEFKDKEFCDTVYEVKIAFTEPGEYKIQTSISGIARKMSKESGLFQKEYTIKIN